MAPAPLRHRRTRREHPRPRAHLPRRGPRRRGPVRSRPRGRAGRWWVSSDPQGPQVHAADPVRRSDAPERGRIRIGDRELSTLGEAELDAFRAAEVGLVLQGGTHLLPYLSAHENVEFAQRPAGPAVLCPPRARCSSSSASTPWAAGRWTSSPPASCSSPRWPSPWRAARAAAGRRADQPVAPPGSRHRPGRPGPRQQGMGHDQVVTHDPEVAARPRGP